MFTLWTAHLLSLICIDVELALCGQCFQCFVMLATPIIHQPSPYVHILWKFLKNNCVQLDSNFFIVLTTISITSHNIALTKEICKQFRTRAPLIQDKSKEDDYIIILYYIKQKRMKYQTISLYRCIFAFIFVKSWIALPLQSNER